MTFTHPWVLLLLAIPVLLIVVPPGRAFGLVMPFDHHEHPRRRWLAWTLGAFDRVPALILAAALLLLAGPQMLKQPHQTRLLTNVQFCLDVSGSMMTDDRYGMARKAIDQLVEQAAGLHPWMWVRAPSRCRERVCTRRRCRRASICSPTCRAAS